jgi:hypothetical protein
MQVEDGTVAGVVYEERIEGCARRAAILKIAHQKKEANSCFMTSAVGSLLF